MRGKFQGNRYRLPRPPAHSTDQVYDEHVRLMSEAWDSRHPARPSSEARLSARLLARWKSRFQGQTTAFTRPSHPSSDAELRSSSDAR